MERIPHTTAGFGQELALYDSQLRSIDTRIRNTRVLTLGAALITLGGLYSSIIDTDVAMRQLACGSSLIGLPASAVFLQYVRTKRHELKHISDEKAYFDRERNAFALERELFLQAILHTHRERTENVLQLHPRNGSASTLEKVHTIQSNKGGFISHEMINDQQLALSLSCTGDDTEADLSFEFDRQQHMVSKVDFTYTTEKEHGTARFIVSEKNLLCTEHARFSPFLQDVKNIYPDFRIQAPQIRNVRYVDVTIPGSDSPTRLYLIGTYGANGNTPRYVYCIPGDHTITQRRERDKSMRQRTTEEDSMPVPKIRIRERSSNDATLSTSIQGTEPRGPIQDIILFDPETIDDDLQRLGVTDKKLRHRVRNALNGFNGGLDKRFHQLTVTGGEVATFSLKVNRRHRIVVVRAEEIDPDLDSTNTAYYRIKDVVHHDIIDRKNRWHR